MDMIRVLVVDDSALMRQVLSDILSQDPQIQVVATAADPYIARDKVKQLNPDVMTLDVEMPRMDGLTFLEKLMQAHPMPVVMVSSLTEKGCQTTIRALELGAVDFVTKPKVDIAEGTVQQGEVLIEKIKVAARARIRKRNTGVQQTPVPRTRTTSSLIAGTHKVICIGASTGGTEAILELLSSFPADAPATVIVQHMPEGFTRSFAERLDKLCRMRVSEAKDGDRILPGHALLAPGGLHMAIVRSGANYSVRVGMGQPVSHHRPSVDVLFRSASKQLGQNAIGIILTGMGSDGAEGLLAMRNNGATTIAQNEQTCVVFGMPKQAIAMGAACDVLPLERIASALFH